MKKQEPISFKVPEISMKTIEVPQAVTDLVVTRMQNKAGKVREKKEDLMTRVLNYEHTPLITAAAVGFLAGVVVGFALSPVKRGINVLSNNDLHNEEFADGDDFDEDFDFDEDSDEE